MQITGRDQLRIFHEACREMVSAGQFDALLAQVRAAGEARGNPALTVLLATAQSDTYVEDWHLIQRDAAMAVDQRDIAVDLHLGLTCQSLGMPEDRQGRIIYRFTLRDEHQGLWVGDYKSSENVTLRGLEAHFAFLRELHDTRDGEARAIDDAICCWLVIGVYCQAIITRCEADPIAANIRLQLRDDSTPRSMESGFVDLLPWFRHAHQPRAVASPESVKEFVDTVKKQRRAEFAANWLEFVARTRVLHRMLGYFPITRFLGRHEMARFWELRVETACVAAGFDPVPRISWRMRNRELTALLRRILEAKGVPDVEGTLDPAHTDALHRRLLAEAEPQGFAPEVDMRTADLYTINFAAMLLKGGPILHDRFARAGPYDPQA